MPAPTLRVWIYLKPQTEERLMYTSLDAAQRACVVGGEIEEWHAYEGSDRMRLIYLWCRTTAGFEMDWVERSLQ
jgi:hypothetical protein